MKLPAHRCRPLYGIAVLGLLLPLCGCNSHPGDEQLRLDVTARHVEKDSFEIVQRLHGANCIKDYVLKKVDFFAVPLAVSASQDENPFTDSSSAESYIASVAGNARLDEPKESYREYRHKLDVGTASGSILVSWNLVHPDGRRVVVRSLAVAIRR